MMMTVLIYSRKQGLTLNEEDIMTIPPEYYICQERDQHGIGTGRWIWEVYDPASGGPIETGVAIDRQRADVAGRAVRELVELAEGYQMGNYKRGVINSANVRRCDYV